MGKNLGNFITSSRSSARTISAYTPRSFATLHCQKSIVIESREQNDGRESLVLLLFLLMISFEGRHLSIDFFNNKNCFKSLISDKWQHFTVKKARVIFPRREFFFPHPQNSLKFFLRSSCFESLSISRVQDYRRHLPTKFIAPKKL